MSGKLARAAWLALVVEAWLSACMVGPDFVPPKTSVLSRWPAATDHRVQQKPADFRAWWHLLDDPVLDRLIDLAYRQNLSLRVAAVRVLEARARLGIAAGNLYPQTQQIQSTLQYQRLSDHSSIAEFSKTLSYWQWDLGLGAAWELDFWGKLRRAVQSASAGWLASIADYESALVSLTADVATSYVGIRTLETRLEIALANVRAQEESAALARLRANYGATSQLDVEQAETSLENTRATVPSLRAQLQQGKNALSLLLGMPPGDLRDLLGRPSAPPVSPRRVAIGIPRDLLRRRPDIRSAELQAAAQCAQIGVAKADYYPAFTLSGSFSFSATDVGTSKLTDLFQWGSRTIHGGPSMQWNVLNYGRIANNVRAQDARFQQLLISYQNTVLAAQQEVASALVGFLQAQDRAEILARATAAARRARDLALDQYRSGVTNFIAVLLAQQTLLSTQDSLAASIGDGSRNLIAVYRALGGGWEVSQGKELLPAEVKDEMKRRTNWGRLLAPSHYSAPADVKHRSSVRLPDW